MHKSFQVFFENHICFSRQRYYARVSLILHQEVYCFSYYMYTQRSAASTANLLPLETCLFRAISSRICVLEMLKRNMRAKYTTIALNNEINFFNISYR